MMFLNFYFNSGGGGYSLLDQEMQTLGYMSVVCKHIWIVVMSTGQHGQRENNGDNLLRCSMVVDGIKESRTHMGSTGSLLLF